MSVLRTADERFAGLPGFVFAPRYVADLAGFEKPRVHYLDEGPRGRALPALRQVAA